MERGVRVRCEKCVFFQPQLRYLGHVITAEGVSPSPEKVYAFLNAPAPKNKQQLVFPWDRELLREVHFAAFHAGTTDVQATE